MCRAVHSVALYLVLASLNFVFVIGENSEARNSNHLEVTTLSGPVRGVEELMKYDDTSYVTFKGIPYAKAPIDDLRFRAPQPVGNWTETLQTKKRYPRSCIPSTHYVQTGLFKTTTKLVSPDKTGLDCLYLNVFKRANSANKVPVIVYIHSGIHSFGESSTYNPELILYYQDVIFVSLNYRLGLFGYSNLGTKKHSGNMGLKDQRMAMKWVFDNIHAFGGDNQKITLMGSSSGAACVHFHILSSESRKYFQQAIATSGTPYSPFGRAHENNNYNRLMKVAKKENKKVKTLADLENFLLETDEKSLSNLTNTNDFGKSLSTIWGPTIERADAEDPFMTKPPEEIYKDPTNNITTNILLGFTNLEYLTFFGMYQDWNDRLDNYCDIELPIHGHHVPLSKMKYRDIAKQFFGHYFDENADITTQWLPFYKMMSDIHFGYDRYKTRQLLLEHSKGKTYQFRFSVSAQSELCIHGKMNGLPKNFPYAGHLSDICYVFLCKSLRSTYDKLFLTSPPIKLHAVLTGMMNMILGFAIDGVPRVKDANFKSISVNENNFADVTDHGVEVGILKENFDKLIDAMEKAEQIAKSTIVTPLKKALSRTKKSLKGEKCVVM